MAAVHGVPREGKHRIFSQRRFTRTSMQLYTNQSLQVRHWCLCSCAVRRESGGVQCILQPMPVAKLARANWSAANAAMGHDKLGSSIARLPRACLHLRPAQQLTNSDCVYGCGSQFTNQAAELRAQGAAFTPLRRVDRLNMDSAELIRTT